MNRQMVKRALLAGFAMFALGLSIVLTNSAGGTAFAAAQAKPEAAIIKIAESIKKGETEEAKKQAVALAKKVDDLDDVMHVFKPRKKEGLGVGKKAGEITPDGIELMLIALGRDAPAGATLAKQGEALEEMAYIVAAVAEVTTAKLPEKFAAKQTKKDWLAWSQEMKVGATELAKAAKSKGAQDVKSAAAKINAACNSCHSVFRN